MLKGGLASLCLLAAALCAPATAAAHGVQGRAETPIPISAFFWVAGGVLIVSFAALARGWSKPKFTDVAWRSAPLWLERAVGAPATEWLARGLTLAVFLFLFAAAAFGSTRLSSNIAPVSIFVVWWVGLVPLSVVFGHVWRTINPWSTLARIARIPARTDRLPPPWLGLWPAALYLTAFAWFELVYPTAAEPRLIAALIVVYTVATLAGMVLYGVDTWLDRGEVFTVYTGILARLSAIETREDGERRRLGFRPPVVGVTKLDWLPAQVAFIAVLIATVSFDGLSGSDLWATRDVAAAERLIELGIGPFTAGIIVATIGLLLTLVLVIGLYEAAAHLSGRAMSRTGRGRERAAAAFAHSLIPIALAYFVAHYFTLFVFQSQDLIRLVSDPFGTGADWFGTADHRIDFQLVSPNLIWAVQVGAIVGGHVCGLLLAHDRAVRLADDARAATRSQYPMLVLMVLLTVSGLWSLSEGMAAV